MISDCKVKDIALARGRLVNLAAAEGHPSEVMDMSFANQFQAMVKLTREGRDMSNDVFVLPEELDPSIAGIKLESMGLSIDTVSDDQIRYRDSYSEGT